MVFRIGLALDGVGWHPAAWLLSPVTEPAALFGARYWAGWGRASAAGGIGFVTLEDGLTAQTEQFGAAPGDPGSRVRGRLDPVVAAAVLLSASDVGEVVVTRNVTHANPFHTATQLASLAAIGPGRVVWRPQVSANARDATAVGGTPTPELRPDDSYVPTRIAHRLRDLFRDAEDHVRTVRDLWTTFPADALGAGEEFWLPGRVGPLPGRGTAVGPLNVPVLAVPPVATLAHHALEPYRLAAAVADRVFLTPTPEHPRPRAADRVPGDRKADPGRHGDRGVRRHRGRPRRHRRARPAPPRPARPGRRFGVDDRHGDLHRHRDRARRDPHRLAGRHGLAGARLRPAVLPEDAERIIRDVVPRVAETGPPGGNLPS
ncbi:hypothetical protein [Amycolatopsis sp. cg9]|uniref:hypothetical protein n=1 Tax=Amycolatopsis sp. cg9 TaxID=3238801 RepID=UPI003524F09E